MRTAFTMITSMMMHVRADVPTKRRRRSTDGGWARAGMTLAVTMGAAVLFCGAPRAAAAPAANERVNDRVGVLLLAHGGNNQWNAAVHKAVRQANLDVPTEVAFGMGMHEHEVRQLKQSLDRLERKGLSRIVVIPLLISSHSEVYRQYEYLLGLRAQPEWPQAGDPLKPEVPIVMGRGLDASPVVSEILLDRAKALSRQPDNETVVLIGHGPVAEQDNAVWLATMEQIAGYLREQGGFRQVLSQTIRDDAPKAVRDEAIRRIRETVQTQGTEGRVLVVPLLLAQGGIERKIPQFLNGLSYIYKGETLLPHPLLAGWIKEQASELATQPATAPASQAAESSTLTGGRALSSASSPPVVQ